MTNQFRLPPEVSGKPETPPGLMDVLSDVQRGTTPPSTGAASAEERHAARTIEDRNNPAGTGPEVTRENRIPINVPDQRLLTPELEGFHLHWFLDRNIPKGRQAGYTFVSVSDLPTMDRSIGGRAVGMTSEDIGGDRISQIGGVNEQGRPENLTLMKIPLEWYFDDQRRIAERNRAVLQQVFRNKQAITAPAEGEADYNMRYTREAVLDMSNGRFKKA